MPGAPKELLVRKEFLIKMLQIKTLLGLQVTASLWFGSTWPVLDFMSKCDGVQLFSMSHQLRQESRSGDEVKRNHDLIERQNRRNEKPRYILPPCHLKAMNTPTSAHTSQLNVHKAVGKLG